MADVDAALPGLDRDALVALAGRWDDGGLWDDIAVLASRFWDAGPTPGPHRSRCWHHLVLAVGNFKREAGRRLRPALDTSDAVAVRPGRSLVVFGTEPAVVVAVDDRSSWPALSGALAGAGVATTTTLLAALWDGQHLVFDRRVAGAANALRAAAGMSTAAGYEPDATAAPAISFAHYDVVRAWVRNHARATGVGVVVVERALYELDRLRRRARPAPPGPLKRARSRRLPAVTGTRDGVAGRLCQPGRVD
ncbi:MAG TPA: hypothetical protein PKA98_07430 [Acidimicrobiales bacterium]|nr:hypothetical protein [Acidimicrobiales bacterium]